MKRVGRTNRVDDYSRWKPEGFKDYLTLGELCAIVKRDPSRIIQLEKVGKIAAPIRVKVGRLSVRLYTADEAATIGRHFESVKTGRPKRKRTRRRNGN